jgi:hypothetical protein
MENKLWSLVFLYEGYDGNLPYASVMAVSKDIEVIKAEMAKYIAEDCQVLDDKNDEYFEYRNFEIHKQSDLEVVLHHKVYVDCYTKYTIQITDIISS